MDLLLLLVVEMKLALSASYYGVIKSIGSEQGMSFKFVVVGAVTAMVKRLFRLGGRGV